MWFFYFLFQIRVMDSRGCFSVDPDKMVTNPKKLMKVGLQIKANLENVTGLIPENVQEYCWHLKLKCTECGEIPDHWQYVTLSEEQPLKVKFIYSEKVPKFCEISTLLLSYVVPVKSKVEISQNFVAFSEYMNFMCFPILHGSHLQ